MKIIHDSHDLLILSCVFIAESNHDLYSFAQLIVALIGINGS